MFINIKNLNGVELIVGMICNNFIAFLDMLLSSLIVSFMVT